MISPAEFCGPCQTYCQALSMVTAYQQHAHSVSWHKLPGLQRGLVWQNSLNSKVASGGAFACIGRAMDLKTHATILLSHLPTMFIDMEYYPLTISCHSLYCRVVRIHILLLHKAGKNLCKAKISCIYIYRGSCTLCSGAGASPNRNRNIE